MADKPKDLSNDEWRRRLSPDQFRVLRLGDTEPPGSGKYYHHHEDGTYRCGACGAALFRSDEKYNSGSGWPSFFDAVDPNAIETRTDTSHGMIRKEILCASCGSHLGHLFEDGPNPTGLRYCVNSLSLDFEEQDKTE